MEGEKDILQNQGLKPQLGLFSAIFVALGSTLGTGIIITHGSILATAGSIAIALIGWIIAGLLTIPQMMIQAEMVSAYPETGGPYVFFKKAKLKPVAFMYGWCYGIWGWPFSIAFRAFITFQFLDMLIRFTTNSDINNFFLNPWILRTFACITIIIFGLVSYFSVKMGAIINNILTILKIGLLLIITTVAFTGFNSDNFNSRMINTLVGNQSTIELWFKGLTFAIALALWGYNGINAVAYMASEFKNPQKNLPIAMILSAIIITIIYALFVISMGGLLNVNEIINKNPDNISSIAIDKLNMKWVTLVLIFMLFILSLSSVFTAIKFAPRLPYAMAKDKLFFDIFARISPKWNSPSIAILANTFLAALLSFIPYTTKFIVIYFTFGAGLMNFFITLVILWCWKNKDYHPKYRMRFPILMLCLSITACFFAVGSGFYTSFKDIDNDNWILILAPVLSILSMISAYPVYYIWNYYYNKPNNKLKNRKNE